MKKIICMCVALFVFAFVAGCGSSASKQSNVSMIAGVQDFINQNQQRYGTAKESFPQSDWASGQRQEVLTTTGRYLFYTQNNEVVGAWKYESNGERTQIFKKNIPKPTQNFAVEATANMPAYTILFQVNMANGKGKYADILIPSYSPGTPKEQREEAAKNIAKKEGFHTMLLYSTEEASKANNSESYRKQYPNALKNGYLGRFEGGVFSNPL